MTSRSSQIEDRSPKAKAKANYQDRAASTYRAKICNRHSCWNSDPITKTGLGWWRATCDFNIPWLIDLDLGCYRNAAGCRGRVTGWAGRAAQVHPEGLS